MTQIFGMFFCPRATVLPAYDNWIIVHNSFLYEEHAGSNLIQVINSTVTKFIIKLYCAHNPASNMAMETLSSTLYLNYAIKEFLCRNLRSRRFLPDGCGCSYSGTDLLDLRD